MKIIRVSNDSFPLWRNQIENFFINSERINFPDQKMSINYSKERCDKVAGFLQDGTAIVFVAVEQKKLLGWVWCHHIRRLNKERLHIAEIAVSDRYRGNGIGSQLLKKVETYAKDNGYREIDLLVTVSNISALEFYKRAFYEEERYLMKKTIEK